MERLIILVIWGIVAAVIRSANNKNNEGKTQKRITQPKRKNVFGTFMEDLEKEMQNEKERQRLERPTQSTQSAQPSQSSMFSDPPKTKAPTMPKAPPKPVGLEIDAIVGDEEIGGIKEANIYKGSRYNNLDFDLKRDLLKGIIYSEILSEPKSLRNMKRREEASCTKQT